MRQLGGSISKDIQRYGLAVAWFNFRFNLAWFLAKALIRKPIRLEIR